MKALEPGFRHNVPESVTLRSKVEDSNRNAEILRLRCLVARRSFNHDPAPAQNDITSRIPAPDDAAFNRVGAVRMTLQMRRVPAQHWTPTLGTTLSWKNQPLPPHVILSGAKNLHAANKLGVQ